MQGHRHQGAAEARRQSGNFQRFAPPREKLFYSNGSRGQRPEQFSKASCAGGPRGRGGWQGSEHAPCAAPHPVPAACAFTPTATTTPPPAAGGPWGQRDRPVPGWWLCWLSIVPCTERLRVRLRSGHMPRWLVRSGRGVFDVSLPLSLKI